MDPENIALFLIFLVILGTVGYLVLHKDELSQQIASVDETLAGKTEKQFDRVEVDDSIRFTYDWGFKNKKWEFTGSANKQAYQAIKDRAQIRREYWMYVSDRSDDEELSDLISLFRQAAQEQGYDPYETVNFVISFVQAMPYTSDKVTSGFDEYRRYPLETLIDGGGDCEDTSILAAALLQEMGYGVVLLAFDDHMAVGVLGSSELAGKRYAYGNGLYYYLETTGKDWGIGDVPGEYDGRKPQIIEVEPKPLLSLDWSMAPAESAVGFTKYYVDTVVGNGGTKDADTCRLTAAFYNRQDLVISEKSIDISTISIGKTRPVRVDINIPRGIESRLTVSVSCGNAAKVEKFSEWATS